MPDFTIEERNYIINYIEVNYPNVNKRSRGGIFLKIIKALDGVIDYFGIPTEYDEPIKRIEYAFSCLSDTFFESLLD